MPDPVGDPQIVDSRLRGNNNTVVKLPRPLMDKPNFDFSFSGLKTAVLTHVKKLTADGLGLTTDQKAEICWAFEEAVADVLCAKAIKCARQYRPKGLILAGGVAANCRLQEELKNRLDKYNQEVEGKHQISFYLPDQGMTGDNAAMIGLAAYYHILKGDKYDLLNSTVDSNLTL
ncbi:MAG: hypothetical protein ABH846_03305 [Patescibacteria group bacterium]